MNPENIIGHFKYLFSLQGELLDEVRKFLDSSPTSATSPDEFSNPRAWLSKQRWIKNILWVCVALSALGVLALVRPFFGGSIQEWLPTTEAIAFTIYIAESLIMFAISLNILIGSYEPTDNLESYSDQHERLDRAVAATRSFFTFWPFLWISWFFLYILLALRSAGVLANPNSVAFLNLANNLSAVVLLSMYIELAEKTQFESTNRSSRPLSKVWIGASMAVVLLLTFELIALNIFAQRPPLASPLPAAASEAQLSPTAPRLLTVDLGTEEINDARKTGANQVGQVTSLVSGILTGLVTGLFVARLTSRSLSVPIPILLGLITFAIIQPVFPFISEPASDQLKASLTTIFIMLALYAKILLLVTVHWMRDSHRLVYYMLREAKIYEEEHDNHYGKWFQLVVRASDPGTQETVNERDA